MNPNERTVARIRAALPSIPTQSEDHTVLSYIFKQLQPAALERRDADDSTTNLNWCANDRLRRYEKEAAS